MRTAKRTPKLLSFPKPEQKPRLEQWRLDLLRQAVENNERWSAQLQTNAAEWREILADNDYAPTVRVASRVDNLISPTFARFQAERNSDAG